MKILNIYFKNINSLHSEGQVHFDQAPLVDADIFAITGENGSGKTSLLDVITLALYGETFKFDRPAPQVMTKNTSSSFAEVVFKLGENQYRSRWQVSREENNIKGKLLAPTMQLVQLTETKEETVLADKPNLVTNLVAEITGMNFQRFTRSIMLAQGDFAAFLNAVDNERLDVLEKIIGIDIYAEHEQEIRQKVNETALRLEKLQQSLAVIKLIDTDEFEALQHDLADFQQQFEEFSDNRAKFQQQSDWLKTLKSLQQKIEQLEKQSITFKSQLEQSQADLSTVANHQDVLAFRDDVEDLDNKTQSVNEDKKNLAIYNRERALLKNQLGSIKNLATLDESLSIDQQSQTIADLKNQQLSFSEELRQQTESLQSQKYLQTEQQQTHDTVLNWLKTHHNEAFLIDNFPDLGKLKRVRHQLKLFQQQQKTFDKAEKISISAAQKLQASLDRADKQISKLTKSQQQLELELKIALKDKTLEQLIELHNDYTEQISEYRNLLGIAEAYEKVSAKPSGLLSFFAEEPLNEITLEEDVNQLKEQIEREQNIIFGLEKAVAYEALLLQHKAERHNLEAGKPCPLCGALQHPFVSKAPAEYDSKQTLLKQRQKLKEIQIVVKKLTAKLNKAQRQGAKKDSKTTLSQQLLAQWHTKTNRLNVVSEDLTISNISLMQQLFKEAKQKASDMLSLEKNSRHLHNKVEQTKANIIKNETSIIQFKQQLKQLNEDWGNRPAEGKKLAESLSLCINEEKILTEITLKQLTELGETMPPVGKEESIYDGLNQRRQDYQNHQLRDKNLTEELSDLVITIAELQKVVNALQENKQQNNKTLQNAETLGFHLALIEKQKLISQKEQHLENLQTELNSLTQQLEQKIIGSRYQNKQELKEMLKLVLSQEQLEKNLTQLQQKLSNNETDLENQQKQLIAEQKLQKTELSLEEVTIQLREINTKRDINHQEITRIKRISQQQQQQQQRYNETSEQVEKQQQQYNEHLIEIEAINTPVFHRNVQLKMADKLLHLSNLHLSKLNNRYRLYQASSDTGLALEIEDAKQENARRLPRTLSGGESFVVSLSLALGLSELATENKGHSINTLFIDEGFGLLDPNTLAITLSTLKSLKTQGKSVGVISHVDNVRREIRTQIAMTKDEQGYSHIELNS